jgi:hypothetical protein
LSTSCKEIINVGHPVAEKRQPCSALSVSKWTWTLLIFAIKTVSRLPGQFINYVTSLNSSKQKRKINLLNSQVLFVLE